MAKRTKNATELQAESGEQDQFAARVQQIRHLACQSHQHHRGVERKHESQSLLECVAMEVHRCSRNIFGTYHCARPSKLKARIDPEWMRAFEEACVQETADMILREVDSVDRTGEKPNPSRGTGPERWRAVVDAVLEPQADAGGFARFKSIGFEWPRAMLRAHQHWHRFDEFFEKHAVPPDPPYGTSTRHDYRRRIRQTIECESGTLLPSIISSAKPSLRERKCKAVKRLRDAQLAVNAVIADADAEYASSLAVLRDSMIAEADNLDKEVKRFGRLVDWLGGLEGRGCRNHVRALVLDGLAEIWRAWKGEFPTAWWNDAEGKKVSRFVTFATDLFVAARYAEWVTGLGDAVKRMNDPWRDKLTTMLRDRDGKVAYSDLANILLGVDDPSDLEPGQRASMEALMWELDWQGPFELPHPTKGPVKAFKSSSEASAAVAWIELETPLASMVPVAKGAQGEET